MSFSSDKSCPLKGWYYVRVWARSLPLIIQCKSHDGSYKNYWLFTLEDWELRNSPNMYLKYRVQTHFFTPGSFIRNFYRMCFSLSVYLLFFFFSFFFYSVMGLHPYWSCWVKSYRWSFKDPINLRSWKYLSQTGFPTTFGFIHSASTNIPSSSKFLFKHSIFML